MQAVEIPRTTDRWQVSRTLREHAPLLSIWGILVVMLVGASVYSPVFRTPENLFNALRQSVFLGIVSVGQTMAIIAGGIDLSVGSTVKLVALIAAGTMQGQESMAIPVVLLCLLIGSAIGLCNGLIVTKLGVAPFIVTLGMYTIVRGFALGYSTTPIGSIAGSLRPLYNAQLGPVPLPVIVFVVIVIFGHLVLTRTAYGRHLYAVGGNEQVARLSGLKVARLKISVFVISGFLAALAGIFLVSRMGVGDPIVGEGLELDSVAAVVLGGTSLFGGRGTLLGTVAAVLILAFVSNIFNLLAISSWYQQLIKGLIILLVVAVYKQER